jgi:CHASE3 domain sensor protein
METGVNAPMQKVGMGKEFIFAIIIIVVALGAGYMIYKKSNEAMQNTQTTNTASSDAVVKQIQTQSSSDDVNSINADVQATDFSNLGK